MTGLLLKIFQKAMELERTRVELQNSKRQCELVKSLMAEATAEKEIMYEVCEPPFSTLSDDILKASAGFQRRARRHV